ncbi:hypothetical protein GCM10010964_43410 [Caldovatus sediminis]|uniref:Uncharacterized protein n=1 Tax=Caldovatus sediminis TaxID=2041189 RepID=A0A8J3ED17_9PROT|nr:hypothetical protein [Caldovatus sediminis]GGG51516.1 hypothetical protein GCM10010964_43410 [Caldovatus sediminis]
MIELIRAAALAGRPCPSNADLAADLGCERNVAQILVRHARALGLIALRSDGPRRVIAAPDDSWVTAAAEHPKTRRGAAGRMRACLRCRASFHSEGPHHRLCDPCRRRAEDDGEFRVIGARVRA